jgi:uncharacterized membrane protein YhaH (DUF805 family)
MSESSSPTETGPHTAHRRFSFLAGRSSRREYWIGVAIVVVLGALLNTVLGTRGRSSVEFVLLFLQIRRFHDFGRTGWWAILGHAVPALEIAGVMALGGNSPQAQGLAMGAASLIGLVFTGWLGSIPGDPHANRFGSPANGRNLREIFG